jgi:hypothetical protein
MRWLGLGLCGLVASAAQARPLATPDASTVGARAGQIEVGIAASDSALTAPAAAAIGLGDRLEASLEAGVGMSTAGGAPAPGDVAAGLRFVVREGSLQERAGPSLALTSAAVVPPDGSALSLAMGGVLSSAWEPLSVHVAASVSPVELGAWWSGLALVGPGDWSLRPLAEVTFEPDVVGLLGGLSWDVSDRVTLDVAAGGALAGALEGTLGLSAPFAMKERRRRVVPSDARHMDAWTQIDTSSREQ